ncbi:TPA: hypothetical protein ACH3X1_011949 [Trebouxia sp. C0004]
MVSVLQLVATLEQSISAATGGAVKVVITSYISGSVLVTTNVLFLDGDVSDAITYAVLASSDTTSGLYGATFGPVIVPSVSISSVASVGLNSASPPPEASPEVTPEALPVTAASPPRPPPPPPSPVLDKIKIVL